jgi:hypothetical protein
VTAADAPVWMLKIDVDWTIERYNRIPQVGQLHGPAAKLGASTRKLDRCALDPQIECWSGGDSEHLWLPPNAVGWLFSGRRMYGPVVLIRRTHMLPFTPQQVARVETVAQLLTIFEARNPVTCWDEALAACRRMVVPVST